MSYILTGKNILVTGGTGSLGKAFVKRVLTGEFGMPESIRIFSRDEFKQDAMRREFPTLDYQLGDIRDYGDVYTAIQGIDIVIHAAALKQVPSCEYFPEQAVKTNCQGIQNLIRAVENSRLPPADVLVVSTDKACKPTTVMGLTKAIQERMMIAANCTGFRTRYIGVRYGNVLESRGSVIPLFKEQAAKGGPLTVTHPEMTRFLLTLDKAINTMMFALEHALPGQIIVPQAPSATVANIAQAIAAPYGTPVKITGIRPAEKMHEIMFSEEEAPHTHWLSQFNYYAIQPELPELRQFARASDEIACIGEYSSRDHILTVEETMDLLGEV